MVQSMLALADTDEISSNPRKCLHDNEITPYISKKPHNLANQHPDSKFTPKSELEKVGPVNFLLRW